MSVGVRCAAEGCDVLALWNCYEKQTKEEIDEVLEQFTTGYCKEHRQSQ